MEPKPKTALNFSSQCLRPPVSLLDRHSVVPFPLTVNNTGGLLAFEVGHHLMSKRLDGFVKDFSRRREHQVFDARLT